MNIEDFREFCLSMDGVTEKMPFGQFARRYDSLLVFYVMNHMFCMIDINDFNWVNVRSTAEEMGVIRDEYASVGEPVNKAMVNWIRFDFGGDVPDEMIFRSVCRAYDIVKGKYSGKR